MFKQSENSHWHYETNLKQREIITITLCPYRSLGNRGYLCLMIGFIGLIFLLSLFFYSMGAWPVIGFLGVEIGLVWFLFKVNYKSSKNFEQISITKNSTFIKKINWSGAIINFTIESPWIKASCIKSIGTSDKLFLNYHAEQLEIGEFLPPQEKALLANALNNCFERMRGAY